MEILILILAVGFSVAFPPAKIIGGNATNITDVPYQVSFEQNEIFQWAHTCGGSIISRNAVVTAAHCIVINSPNSIRFRAGSNNIKGSGTIHQARNITIHPQFDSTNKDYDIAFITVVESFEFSDSEQPIRIATSEPSAGDVSLISGWGVTNVGGKEEGDVLPSKTLQSVKVPIVNRETCRNQYGSEKFTSRMICAGSPEGGKDSCLFDSGGPVVVNGSLVGIVSHGEGCGRPGNFKMHTNVAFFKDWISQQILDSL